MKKTLLISSVLVGTLSLFACHNNDVEKEPEAPTVTQGQVEAPEVEQQEPVVETPEVETPKVEEPKEKTPVTPTIYRFGLGDTVPITSNRGDYEITFTEAYFTDDRNQFSDKQVDKVLVLVYEYKNISYDVNGDGLWIVEGIHYQVYGEDGFSLDTYPVSNPYYQDYATVGRSSRGSEAFAVVGDQHHFEIELGQDVIVEFDVE